MLSKVVFLRKWQEIGIYVHETLSALEKNGGVPEDLPAFMREHRLRWPAGVQLGLYRVGQGDERPAGGGALCIYLATPDPERLLRICI